MPSISSKRPAGIDWIPRELRRLREDTRQSTAAVVDAVRPQVDFLLSQEAIATAVPGGRTVITQTPPVTTGDMWLAFDPSADASVTITTSSTGNVAFQAGGFMQVYVIAWATVLGYIGVEILDSNGEQIRPPGTSDGNILSLWGDTIQYINSSSGMLHEVSLVPNTEYVFRCRRGYAFKAGIDVIASAEIQFNDTGISVRNLGM